MNTCKCGHSQGAHQHYRNGTDCAQCECRTYRTSLLRAIGLQKCLRCGSRKAWYWFGYAGTDDCLGPCTWDTGETKP